jgi:hypothetical protein
MDEQQKVTVTDSAMSFCRRVGSTIKREVAAIPAALILMIAGFILTGVLARILINR